MKRIYMSVVDDDGDPGLSNPEPSPVRRRGGCTRSCWCSLGSWSGLLSSGTHR